MYKIFCENSKRDSLRKWLSISFLNLSIVALLGVIMRYKILFYLPYTHQKFLLHSHSHFAFAGWITQTLMVLLVNSLPSTIAENNFKKYRWLLYANLITAYGMLVCFIFQGYGLFPIAFSTFSIFVSYVFAIYFWRDLNKQKERTVSKYWFKASLLFNVLSSLGAFTLAYMMANKIMNQNWQLASVYFYLHFQYNGWFFFAGMGLLVLELEKIKSIRRNLKHVFILFCFAIFPAYFLSALWLPFPRFIYWTVIAAVISQLIAWVLMIKIFVRHKDFMKQHFTKYGRILFLLSAIAFSIKILLQAGSVHPALSQLSYGFRPIVIGYLHLVLLGVTTIFIIGYIISFRLVPLSSKLLLGLIIFVTGIIFNEILLMLQGVTSLSYNTIPGINMLLLIAAITLLSGISLILFSTTYKKSQSPIEVAISITN